MARDPRIDRAEQALIDLYREAERTLQKQVADAEASGQLGTARYRRARLAAIRRYLSDVQDAAIPYAADLAAAAYQSGVASAAADVGSLLPDFGSGIHQEAIEILADNIASGLNGAAETVGRQVDDYFRRVGLDAASELVLAGETLRDATGAATSALRARGVSAFVDASGRTWNLDRYAEMVVRTNTADAIVRGNVNKAGEDGYDLVEVLVIDDERLCEICGPYEGKTYSLNGATPGFEQLDELPPFHPNCRCDLNILTEAPPQQPEDEPYDYSPGEELPAARDFIDNYEDLANAGSAFQAEDRLMAQLTRDRGFDAKPRILDGPEFDRTRGIEIEANGQSRDELYRGISDTGGRKGVDLAEDFKSGELFVGDGMIGRGTYSSPEFYIADGYSAGGGMLTLKLAPGSRTISLADANALSDRTWKQIREDYVDAITDLARNPNLSEAEKLVLGNQLAARKDALQALYRSPTSTALMNGYDAIIDPSYPQVVILNRGRVIVRRKNR